MGTMENRIFLALLIFASVLSAKGINQCGTGTSDGISYFVNPDNFTEKCTFTVKVADARVTQLRLDFDAFSLAQPVKISGEMSNDAYSCNVEKFTVSSVPFTSSVKTFDNLGFSELCGENSGQHIYIPVDASLGSDSVLLTVTGENKPKPPRWGIKITQIDCSSVESGHICAPEGCLQYYPEPFGNFESFNFNEGNGPYQGSLNYAICFKRYEDMCSIQYSSEIFHLPSNDPSAPYGNDGCNKPTTDPNNPFSQDYLFIPNARWGSNVDASLLCGYSLQESTASTNEPGPKYVFFHTDEYDYMSNGEDTGFRITYQQSSSGCQDMQGFFG